MSFKCTFKTELTRTKAKKILFTYINKALPSQLLSTTAIQDLLFLVMLGERSEDRAENARAGEAKNGRNGEILNYGYGGLNSGGSSLLKYSGGRAEGL